MTLRGHRRSLLFLLIVALASATACGTDDSPPSSDSGASEEAACAPAEEGAGQVVDVTLREWEVAVASPPEAGAVTFEATNRGEETHELVVVRTDDPSGLPVTEGRVDEDALPEGAFLGEVEGLLAGDTCSLTFEVPAGTYALFCNIVEREDDGELESHFEQGMVTTVEVA